jgi:DNA-binding transcriptional MerR regulator
VSYTVRQLATMAGVSVRTLHYYDQIGLLEPSSRSRAGYRLYGEEDLMRLQQVLFYRELEVPLDRIRETLERPDFDPVAALEEHRRSLEEKGARIARLLETVDKTIARMGGEATMLTDEELYEGFTKEQIRRYTREAKERWGKGPQYAESQRRVRSWSKEKLAAIKKAGAGVEEGLAAIVKAGRLGPEAREAQELIARWADYIRSFYDPSPEVFRGLGEMYVENPEFRARYDALAPGLAEFMRDAMAIFADNGMTTP